MKTKKLSEKFSTSAQLQLGEIEAAKAAGFRSIIVNRPDGEAAGQPSFAEIETAARDLDMEAIHIPVSPGQFDAVSIDKFRGALDNLPGPVLGFCASGMRSEALWKRSRSAETPSAGFFGRLARLFSS